MASQQIDQFDTPSDGGDADAQPYIGVMFECCNVYTRVYRRPHQLHYSVRCPRCLRVMRVRVGPDGTNTRIFRAR